MTIRLFKLIEKPPEGQIAIPTNYIISYNRYRRRKYIEEGPGEPWSHGYQYKYTVWVNLWLILFSFKFMGRIHYEGT